MEHRFNCNQYRLIANQVWNLEDETRIQKFLKLNYVKLSILCAYSGSNMINIFTHKKCESM